MKANRWRIGLLAAGALALCGGVAWAGGSGVVTPNARGVQAASQAGCTTASQALNSGMTPLQASQTLHMSLTKVSVCQNLALAMTHKVPTGTALRMGIKQP
jgi:hypothetical protein